MHEHLARIFQQEYKLGKEEAIAREHLTNGVLTRSRFDKLGLGCRKEIGPRRDQVARGLVERRPARHREGRDLRDHAVELAKVAQLNRARDEGENLLEATSAVLVDD
jgi:hypothetical protein